MCWILLTSLDTDFHADGRVPLDERPLVVADPVVVHAVPPVQDGPVGGQLDHHVLPSVAAGGLVHICTTNQSTAKSISQPSI